jgi:AcrR family transcriptional regulator
LLNGESNDASEERMDKPASEPAAESNRAKLLEAAAQVFAEVGYPGATMCEICARAGVNGALVNDHFGDKLEL